MNPTDPPPRTLDVHTEHGPQPRAEIARLVDLIHGIRTAMLVTRSTRGHLRGRPMITMQSELRDELWFFIDRRSAVVDEITEEHQVGITYVDPPRYVTVAGVAHVVDDPERVRQFWHPGAAEWFPDGPDDDPHLVLLRVQLEEAEVWDRSARTMVRLLGFDASDERGVPRPARPSSPEPPTVAS